MKEDQQKNNNYWFTTYTLLTRYTDDYYDHSYDNSGNTPREISDMSAEQINALINIISEATSIIEGSGKNVEIVISKVDELPYKK
ncbi:MAG: hypothetical protein Unbinned4388contig1000_33 [Prokaryotic dsDNA virus sp.]|nr:MAG: hypothetical protein Unbinned4388contig1000_33 [Prokaryotic dsDNA virus sp.]|tara:strand:- start:54996 stop:55250 length:255 start_codon:yes stop_codon:yes gene_type:complete